MSHRGNLFYSKALEPSNELEDERKSCFVLFAIQSDLATNL